MRGTIQELIAAGSNIDDAATEAALRRIPPTVYRVLHEGRPSSFAFLAELPLAEVQAFVRALSRAEVMKLCPYPGSVSLLIPAFVACRSRLDDEYAAIADWIVVNHENPYTPFNFRRTRAYWAAARTGSPSPTETFRRVRSMESNEAHEKAARRNRHEARECISRLGKGESPSSPALREKMLHEMERKAFEE